MGNPLKVFAGILWAVLSLVISIQVFSNGWILTIQQNLFTDPFLMILYWVSVVVLVFVVNIIVPLALILDGMKGTEVSE